jgi:hypothetical protein
MPVEHKRIRKRIVHVVWIDAQRQPGWASEDKFIARGLMEFHNVGILVRKTDEAVYMTIGMPDRYDPNDDDCLGIHVIPIGMVEKIKTLGHITVEDWS